MDADTGSADQVTVAVDDVVAEVRASAEEALADAQRCQRRGERLAALADLLSAGGGSAPPRARAAP